jgi:chromosome segregation ATPase
MTPAPSSPKECDHDFPERNGKCVGCGKTMDPFAPATRRDLVRIVKEQNVELSRLKEEVDTRRSEIAALRERVAEAEREIGELKHALRLANGRIGSWIERVHENEIRPEEFQDEAEQAQREIHKALLARVPEGGK